MAESPTSLLVVFVYVAAVVLSLPAATSVLLLSRRLGVRRAIDVVALAVVTLVGVSSLAVGLLAGARAGATLAAGGAAAFVFLWALPVRAGSRVIRRTSYLDEEAALGYAVAGLPVAMLASAAWFVLPGGGLPPLDPAGPQLWVAGGGALIILLAGPGLAGTWLHRLRGSGR